MSLASTGCVLALLFFCLPASARATDIEAGEAQKIDYLIASIETLQDAQFIRNDTSYNAKAAADHLRLKLKLAGSHVTSADDFIRYCASASSVSGKPYLIRFSDGREVAAETFLRQKLKEYESVPKRSSTGLNSKERLDALDLASMLWRLSGLRTQLRKILSASKPQHHKSG